MFLYAKYVIPQPASNYKVETYASLPSVVSKKCTKIGKLIRPEGGKFCSACKELRKLRGSRSFTVVLKRWESILRHAIERREKDTLTEQDVIDAKAFASRPKSMLTTEGIALQAEAVAQISYVASMARLDKLLPKKNYKLHTGGAAPGMNAVFQKAAELCNTNPTFQSSLVVSLLKAAVAKGTSTIGANAKTPVKVLNFIRLIGTYDKNAAQVVSANVGGPGDRWVRRMNAKDRKDCIIDSGNDDQKLLQRMEQAVKRRQVNGVVGAFHLSIDATKVVRVLELSRPHGCIMGGAHPQHMIPVDGLAKSDAVAIMDGKSKTYGQVDEATEVKVAVMSFQCTPRGTPVMEVVAARPQTNNESNDFIEEMEQAATNICNQTGSRFVNFAVDSVSCELIMFESQFVDFCL